MIIVNFHVQNKNAKKVSKRAYELFNGRLT